MRLPYTEAVEILKSRARRSSIRSTGAHDLQAEHERYLTEKHFQQPVILFDYPRSIKPFYMRVNDDGRTVRAMDILVPNVGEIIGGSQREERLDVLEERMREQKLDPASYWWYLDLRRYGTVPHSGFGLGLERAIQFITGMGNIRDVIPFPRTPGSGGFFEHSLGSHWPWADATSARHQPGVIPASSAGRRRTSPNDTHQASTKVAMPNRTNQSPGVRRVIGWSSGWPGL